ncbi:MAG: acetyl-coenzyme A synthetase N-terminal domain-containing protein, partial [Casimicrobium sp.]
MSKQSKYEAHYARARDERDSFWTQEAQGIDWRESFTQVCDFSKPPFAKWFVGGTTNLCHNAIDRHLESRGDQVALK